MIKFCINILFIFFIIGCSIPKKDYLVNDIILAYNSYESSKINKEIYLALEVDSYDIYVQSKDYSIIQTSIYNLFFLYDKEYKSYDSFEVFLKNIINKELRIEKEKFYKIGLINSFYLNNDLIKEFNEIGFTKFRNKYSSFDKTCKCYTLKSFTDVNKTLTIKYIFYQNNFLTQSNSNVAKKW